MPTPKSARTTRTSKSAETMTVFLSPEEDRLLLALCEKLGLDADTVASRAIAKMAEAEGID
jgi:hypothetical protein